MNILIIGGSGNASSANSACVRNMAQEFIRRGHKVWNLASGDEFVTKAGDFGGAELWQIPEDYYGKLVKKTAARPTYIKQAWFWIVSLVRHVVLMPFYPMTSPCKARKTREKASDIVRENNIELIIAMHNDYSNIYSGIKLKKQYGDGIRVVDYHLDLRTASLNTSALIQNYVKKHALKSIVEECAIVDKILIPFSGKRDIESISGIDMKKIQFVGFPVYIEDLHRETCELPFEKDYVNISYIGTLSSDNRDPRYILKQIEQVSRKTGKKIKVHFWGNANGMERLLQESPVASYHGMLDNKYVRYIQDNSDFLLNIGNAVAYNMLPSKVFGMFATGKPIINVITHPQDATILFFKTYNFSIDINEFEHQPDVTVQLADGIVRLLNTPRRDSIGLFDDFKPETICDIIER